MEEKAYLWHIDALYGVDQCYPLYSTVDVHLFVKGLQLGMLSSADRFALERCSLHSRTRPGE